MYFSKMHKKTEVCVESVYWFFVRKFCFFCEALDEMDKI